MELFIQSAVAGIAVMSAFFDFTRREIPNALPIALCAASLLAWACLGRLPGFLEAGAAFLAGLLLYLTGAFGAGDVKLFSSACLFFPGKIASLSLVTALSGGLLALAVLLAGFFFKKEKERGVPYGAAIAAGILALLWI